MGAAIMQLTGGGGMGLRNRMPTWSILLALLALSGCAVNTGTGVTIGEQSKAPVASKLEWTSWADAQRAADLSRKPIVLYVIGKAREGTAEFDGSLFDNESVKLICHDVSCVRLAEGSTDTVFSNKRGVSVLLPSGELLYQFESAPNKDAFVAAIRRAVLLAQPRRAPEPKQISNDAKK